MNLDTETLLQYLDDRLSAEDRDAVNEALARQPDAQAELTRLQALRTRVRSTSGALGEALVPPFLATRVLARLDRRARDVWWPETAARLAALFRPLAIASVMLAMALAAYNASSSDVYEADRTLAEEMLGLPPLSVSTAYDLTY